MIFCVEDDAAIRNMMIYTLNVSGLQAEGFSDGEGLFQALEHHIPRLILLDIMLPGMDGIEILRKIRARSITAHIPVIMASARGTEYDRIMGLDLGADDYLAKPFSMMEMVSRVKAVLRRSEPRERQGVLRVGRLTVDREQRIVTLDGERIRLTLKEYELLCLFMENTGRVYSRDQLLASVWEADFAGETRTVDVHIGTLRTKLGPCGEYIETVRGVGYRMEDRL